MSDMPDIGAKLTALVRKSYLRRKNTLLAGLKVSPPWEGKTWEGVKFYNAQQDPEVTNKDALSVCFMMGADVPPHVTLGIINSDQKAELEEFKANTDLWLQGLAFACKSVMVFPISKESLELGAKGYGSVVVQLEVPPGIHKLRLALQACVPHPAFVLGDVGTEPSPWNPHVTVAYVADQESAQQLQTLLTPYIGQKVNVHGWF